MSRELIRVGDILHGYCNGYFGRDSYECKRVEALGSDWIVVRYVNEGTSDAITNFNDWKAAVEWSSSEKGFYSCRCK